MLKFKKMGTDKVPVLLVTANVGSIFEDPSVLLPIWISEFLQTVTKMEPKFIALHMQEVGGKTYERSMQYVQDFLDRLCNSPELKLFDRTRIYLDEDYSSAEKFTALGNIYLVHQALSDVKIWDFTNNAWAAVEGREVHAGDIEAVPTKEKAKFPQHFFPECKWSRKGFLRTRWLLRGTAIELVNIHLFHDASNLLALEAHPSVYCRSRRRALRHTLRHLHSDVNATPYFIFGDFNFRTDTGGVVKKLTEDLPACRVHNTNKSVEHTKLQFRNAEGRLLLSVSKKEFAHADHQKIFREPWLQKYDRELEALKPHLYEFPIKFPPSYPFEENVELPTHYMKTRCPSWCDRILLSQTARLLLQQQDGQRLGDNRHVHGSSDKEYVPLGDRNAHCIVPHGDRSRGVPMPTRVSTKSMADSSEGSPSRNLSSNHTSSSESSPARAPSPAQPQTQGSSKKQSLGSEWEGLSVPGIALSRKSIADPTSVQHAINASLSTRTTDNTPSSEGSPSRRRLTRNQSEGSPKPEDARRLLDVAGARRRIDYGVIGETSCMGDHKPIYLRIMLQSERGTLSCCDHDAKCDLCNSSTQFDTSDACRKCPSTGSLRASRECFQPLSHPRFSDRPDLTCRSLDRYNRNSTAGCNKVIIEQPRARIPAVQCHNNSETDVSKIPNVHVTKADYSSYDGIIVNNIDTHFLYTTSSFADPYTPESVDSHSPNPEVASKDSSVSIEDFAKASDEDESATKLLKENSTPLQRDRSVSPGQLKMRLEDILLMTDEPNYPKKEPCKELPPNKDSTTRAVPANSWDSSNLCLDCLCCCDCLSHFCSLPTQCCECSCCEDCCDCCNDGCSCDDCIDCVDCIDCIDCSNCSCDCCFFDCF